MQLQDMINKVISRNLKFLFFNQSNFIDVVQVL